MLGLEILENFVLEFSSLTGHDFFGQVLVNSVTQRKNGHKNIKTKLGGGNSRKMQKNKKNQLCIWSLENLPVGVV